MNNDKESIAGLFSGVLTPQGEQKPIPLKNVSVKVHIIDFCAEVILHQEYYNEEEQHIEARYDFPLDDNSAVNYFAILLDGQTLHGTMKKKDEAKQIYTNAVNEGRFAGLFQQNCGDRFSIDIGNIGPKKKVDVNITYATQLKLVDGKNR